MLRMAYRICAMRTIHIRLHLSYAIGMQMSVQYIFCAYVTLEPCAHRGRTLSCAEFLAQLGLSRVVIGTRDTNAQAASGAEILRRGSIEVKFDVCHAAAEELAEPFYLTREGGFCFIKINAALNGAVHGRIGSEKQRAFVHELRGVCNYVGVGGQTVRADRPTLDARAAKFNEISTLTSSADMLALDACVAPQNLKLRAPDVWIYSRRNSYNKPNGNFTRKRKMYSECVC